MNDDTRKLLKVFGMAITDSEAEAEKLVTAAAQLSGNSGKEEIIALLKNASDLNRELNTRWLEITQRVGKRRIHSTVVDFQIDKILWDDMATLPLFQYLELISYSDTITGVVYNGPLGVTWNANEWAVAS